MHLLGKNIKYPHLRSAMRTVPHSDDFLVPTPPFKSVCSGFLGNTCVPDYRACIEKLLKSYEDMGCRMSLKIHFLYSHLNFFQPNLVAVSDEHGEIFHRDIMKMESNYKGKWNASMMGDFCWILLRDIPEAKYTRSSKKIHFWLSVVLWIV